MFPFLNPIDIKKEKQEELENLRRERRNIILLLKREYETSNVQIQKYIDEGHKLDNYKFLFFSYDSKPIPFIYDGDGEDRLINYDVCGESDNDVLKPNEFRCISYELPSYYKYVKFERVRTDDENKFMADYYKLMSYSRIADITKFKPSTTNDYTIYIFNILKEIRKQDLIKSKEEKSKQIIDNYTPDKSKERLNTLITNYETNKQLNKINKNLQKQLNIKDKGYNPDLFKQHRLQLKPDKTYPTKTITFTLDNKGYPYRTYNKLKSLDSSFDKEKYYTNIKHYNNFDLSKSKKEYNLKTYSKYKFSFIGDIFFEGKGIAFLLLVNINTRYAYAYKLGKIEEKTVINVDYDNEEHTITFAEQGQKTTKALIEAFDEFINVTPVNILRFDGERAIGSQDFQDYLRLHKIKFIPSIPGTHTSLSIIDRLCRTIRDIAFNLNWEKIYTQEQMNKILNYYNNSRHETLTQTLFKSYPELKEVYKFISPWIMEHNTFDLETKFVKECIKYNLSITSNPDYNINKSDVVEIYNDTSKLEKRRTKISKDKYKVINKKGNIYHLQNINNDKEIFKPRYQIRKNFLF